MIVQGIEQIIENANKKKAALELKSASRRLDLPLQISHGGSPHSNELSARSRTAPKAA